MTPRQEQFVREYLVDLNATQAAIRVGYSEKSAKQQGAHLLSLPNVKAAIDAAKAQRAQQTDVNAQRVLQEYLHLAFGDLRELFETVPGGLRIKPVSEWPESVGRSLAGIKIKQTLEKEGDGFRPMEVIEFKLWSKTEALAKLGAHLKLFNEVGSKNNPLVAIGATVEDLAAARKELEEWERDGKPA